jgi:hypothetical protein
MATLKMNLRQYVGYNKKLQSTYKQVMLQGMRAGALRAIPILHLATTEAPPASQGGTVGAFDTGAYRQRWKTKPIRDGVVILNDAIYADIIEKGRRVGAQMPNITDIERWARRKLYPKLGKGQYGPDVSARRRTNMAKDAAYPIARAISKRGLKSRNVLGSVTDRIIKTVNKEIKNAFERAVGKM